MQAQDQSKVAVWKCLAVFPSSASVASLNLSPKRQRAGALQDALRISVPAPSVRQLLECGCPLPLSHPVGGSEKMGLGFRWNETPLKITTKMILFIRIAAALCFLAVAFGAFGA